MSLLRDPGSELPLGGREKRGEDPNIPKNTNTQNIWREKKKNGKRLGRGTSNTCAKIQGLPQNRRGRWTPKKFRLYA